MISEDNMLLLKEKCIDIAKAFNENWKTVGKAVDKMLVDAKVLPMYYKAMKFNVRPKSEEYEMEFNSHGYGFAFVWDGGTPNKFVLKIHWASTWSSVSFAGASYWALGIDAGGSIEEGVALMVEKLAVTKSRSLVEWKNSHDSSIFDELAKGAVEATNNFIRLMTSAYNKALDLERDNDNFLLNAFELNADGPTHIKPKQYDVNIVERKSECVNTQS